MQITDGEHTWEAASSHSWTREAEHRTVGRLMPAVDALYDGTTLRESLGSDWLAWVPAARQALGCPGTFAFAYARDSRLLRLQMAVIYPRSPASGANNRPGGRALAPVRPVPVDELPGLAAHWANRRPCCGPSTAPGVPRRPNGGHTMPHPRSLQSTRTPRPTAARCPAAASRPSCPQPCGSAWQTTRLAASGPWPALARSRCSPARSAGPPDGP